MIRNMIRRLEDKLLIANDEHVEAGLAWYKDANSYVNDCSKIYGVPEDICAQVMAILSPGTTWERNMHDLKTALEYRKDTESNFVSLPFSTYKANVRKAWRVLNGQETLLPKSKKTYAFYRNIMLDPEHVTIDRHAFKAAASRTMTRQRQAKSSSGISVSKSLYVRAEKAYKSLANKYSLHPYEMQAIIWLVQRN